MRPLKLIISGFGTYCQRTEIDLAKLGTKGLFLITGDTGSGKTTIFDAITYALFGDLNGENRNVSMIRSTFATPDVPTEVELTFEYKGKVYNVKRNPEYQRMAKRGDKLTTQIAEATLTMPDGSVITQGSKVTAAIVDLLRINKEQFSQIVMIAQGDFQKLLMADTDDRIKIFRNLFKTDYYLKLQNRLLDEEKALGAECKTIRNEMSVYLNSVQCDSENTLKIQLEKAQKNELPIAEAFELIKKIISEDVINQQKLNNQLSEVENQLLQNAELLGLAKKIETAELEISNKSEMYKQEKAKNEELQISLENHKKNIPQREKKESEYAVLSKELSDYDELETEKAKLSDLESQITKKQNFLIKTSSICEDLEKEKNQLSEELKEMADTGEKLITLKTELEKLEERKSLFLSLSKDLVLMEKNQKEYNDAVEQYKTASVNAEKLDESYKAMRKAFMDEQAGILASELEDEKPCPVCGSIHHPNPAKKSAKAPGESELNDAEKMSAVAQKTAEEKNRICVEKKSELNGKKESVSNQWKKLFGNTLEDEKVEALEDKLSKETENVKTLVNEKQGLIIEEEKKFLRKKKIEERIPEVEKEILENSNIQNQLTAELSGLDSSKKACVEQIEKFKINLRFESKAFAENELLTLDTEIKNMKAAFEKSQTDFMKSSGYLASLEGEIKQLEQQLQEDKKIDVKEAISRDSELKLQKNDLGERLQLLNTRIDQNKRSVFSLEKSAGKLSDMEVKFAWVSSLSKTANGNLTGGKEKIRLETYIQMNYFDRIIAHANKRLMIMSDGQYELIRQKEAENLRSQTGLELDVIDHYNGGQRSVKSLSGGESFEASLALALGLSDEVRMSAGGIQLDSMFVDEGFGTLDSETLQKAFKALSSITEGNRIVGIISHVDLLKEKIDRQIVVKKERTGGSTVQINV